MTTGTPKLYALLIGINNYDSDQVPDLDGCLNDMGLMGALLKRYFGVPEENVHLLREKEATREAIENAFQEQLTARAQAWASTGKKDPAPAFLFYYAGHGSQAPDATGQEPDALDETIVPYDSREPGRFDIKDWELGLWLDQLTEHTDNVTVILDCCHSGSGTREVELSPVKVRACPPDRRQQPTNRPTGTRSLRLERPEQRYVLLAACKDSELARELLSTNARGETRAFGAFTHHLYRAVDELWRERGSSRPPTYSDLHARVKRNMRDRSQAQTPQREGDVDRVLFGGARMKQGFPFVVEEIDDEGIWINGGLVHGLTVDTLLHAYPPDALDSESAGPPIALLRVANIGSVRSACAVEESDSGAVPVLARVAIFRPSYGNMQRTVALQVADTAITASLRTQFAGERVAPYASLVAEGTRADWCIRQLAPGAPLELLDQSGARLGPSFDPAKMPPLGRAVAHIVRYQNALNLRNLDSSSELAGSVTLGLKRLVVDGGQPQVADFPAMPNGEIVIGSDELTVIELLNEMDDSGDSLHVAVFAFAFDWSIVLVFPRVTGAREALKPLLPFRLGFSRKRQEQLIRELPATVNEVRETIKVIATRDEADYDLLQQTALFQDYASRSARPVGPQAEANALSKLLELAMRSGTTRFAPPKPRVQDEWTTVDLEYYVVQPPDNRGVTRWLREGERAELPAYRIAFETPVGFSGRVRVLSERQSIRYRGVAPWPRVVPGLSRFGEAFHPLGVTPTHYAGAPGAVVEVEATAVACRSVTAQNPLRLHLPAAMMEGGRALAIAHDGFQYYLVGRTAGESAILPVEGFPAPVDSSTRRISLFLYSYRGTSWPAWMDAGWKPAEALPWDA